MKRRKLQCVPPENRLIVKPYESPWPHLARGILFSKDCQWLIALRRLPLWLMSAGEIILILFVYLLLFGAKGVPALAQTLGKAVYQFRNAAKDVQNEIMQGANEVRKQTNIRLDQLDLDLDDSKRPARAPASPPEKPSPPPSPEPSSAPPSEG